MALSDGKFTNRIGTFLSLLLKRMLTLCPGSMIVRPAVKLAGLLAAGVPATAVSTIDPAIEDARRAMTPIVPGEPQGQADVMVPDLYSRPSNTVDTSTPRKK